MDESNSKEGEKCINQEKDSDPLLIFKQLFSTIWIRCFIQKCDGLDGFLLDSGYGILLYISVFSYIIFFIGEIIK